MVIPITQKSHTDGYARVQAWLPEGEWTDIFTGDKYVIPQGGIEKTLLRKLDSIPVLARAGAVLPLSRDKGNSVENPSRMDVCVFTGNGNFSLYEDGMNSGNNALAVTDFGTFCEAEEGYATQTLTISASGDCSVIPADRTLRVLFKDLDWEKTEITVYQNGERLQLPLCLTDSAAVEFPFVVGCEYTVKAHFAPQTTLERLKARAWDILLRAEYHNDGKTAAWHELLEMQELSEFVFKLERSQYISPAIAQRILETL